MLFRVVTALAMIAGLSVGAQAATIKVHGSTTVASNVMLPHKSEIEQSSGHSLTVVANGSSRGIVDLVSGKADMAMISAPLDSTAAKVGKKNPGLLDGVDLQGHQVGETRVAFIVNPANAVKELTLSQVADILTGKVTNWKAFGGADQPIVVVSESKGGGMRSMVEKEVLGGGEITGNLREVPNGPQVPKIIAQLPNAFGIASMALVSSAVAEVKTDQAIAQPLILVTIGGPSKEAGEVISAARSMIN